MTDKPEDTVTLNTDDPSVYWRTIGAHLGSIIERAIPGTDYLLFLLPVDKQGDDVEIRRMTMIGNLSQTGLIEVLEIALSTIRSEMGEDAQPEGTMQ